MSILKEHQDLLIRLTSVIVICILEVIALIKGIDGAVLKVSFVLIGLLAGISANTVSNFFKTKE